MTFNSRRAIAAAIVIVGLLGATSGSAQATNDDHIRVPNGQNVRYSWVFLDANFTAAADWARTRRIDPTDVNTSAGASLPSWDVKVGQGNYAGWDARWGEYQCMSGFQLGAVFVCTDGRVRFHTARAWDATNRRDVACHEMGHSLGLGHRSTNPDTCMEATVQYGAAQNGGYGTHSVGHLNTWY